MSVTLTGLQFILLVHPLYCRFFFESTPMLAVWLYFPPLAGKCRGTCDRYEQYLAVTDRLRGLTFDGHDTIYDLPSECSNSEFCRRHRKKLLFGGRIDWHQRHVTSCRFETVSFSHGGCVCVFHKVVCQLFHSLAGRIHFISPPP
ncbi:hypothetical protein ASPFODRAFT_42082 [Aspergillus luchuensis CBS 106.47]|uniref:Secreted protein n=1 Tax=Aspergillus luchuensis (strain CBS 106.47) TaxID=1137211 RepID=A0A1M3TQK9_ASPLC|nr:hypothetical protein ASPFODRAFT_42082 [Aspergillus luchuensis CBS 106.47]